MRMSNIRMTLLILNVINWSWVGSRPQALFIWSAQYLHTMAALITITVRVFNYLISFRHPKYVSNNSHCLHHQRFVILCRRERGSFFLEYSSYADKKECHADKVEKGARRMSQVLLKIPAAAATYEESLVQQIAPMLLLHRHKISRSSIRRGKLPRSFITGWSDNRAAAMGSNRSNSTSFPNHTIKTFLSRIFGWDFL